MTRLTKTLLSTATLLAAASFVGSANAATYTWTGNVNGDWAEDGNWVGGVAPVADGVTFGNIGGALSFKTGESNRLVFDAATSTLPTTNIPTFGGGNNALGATPQVDLLNGTMTFVMNSKVFWNLNTATNFATVGDGNTANGLANLTYNQADVLNRSANSLVQDFIVNADGTLTFNTTGVPFQWSTRDDRGAKMFINGGAIVFNSDIKDIQTSRTNHLVDLTAAGSTFTAKFGSAFSDLAAVQAELGAGKFFQSSTALSLQAIDNSNGTFTVFAPVPEPGSLALLGMGGLCLIRRRRNG